MATATKQDPEFHHLVGKGMYDNCRLATASWDDRYFRIVPACFPWLEVAVTTAVIGAGFIGFHLFLKYNSPDPSWVKVYLAPLGIGVLTCTVNVAYTYVRFRNAQGPPWLVFDKMDRTVSLPRHGVRFALEDVAYLQYITALLPEPTLVPGCHSELNLVTRQGGERRRWHLLNSIFGCRAFEYLLRPLAAETPLPVLRFNAGWRGKGMTVTPFRS
jgi:hypothetical protein